MKITDSDIVKQVLPQTTQKNQKTEGGNFDALLEKNIENLNTTPSQTAPADMLQPSSHIFFDTAAVAQEEVVQRVTGFLDMMEEYSSKLDSSATLKDISPLVAKMELEKAELQQLAESLPQGDEVRAILDEALIRSSVEVVKFNRGDYL